MEQFDAAERSYAMALELDPSIRRSKSFKVSLLSDVPLRIVIADALCSVKFNHALLPLLDIRHTG